MPISSITYRNHTFCYKAHGNGINRFVLAVVSDYVKEHPAITYNELKLVFPDELQNNTARPGTTVLGVFATVEFAQGIERRDRVRYFINENEPIALQNKQIIVVTGEWGSEGPRRNLQRFLENVMNLGENLAVEYF